VIRTRPTPLLPLLVGSLLAAILGATIPGPTRAQEFPAVQLVESWPVETTLDDPEIPDAPDVWLEMIGSAQQSLEFAEFYASNAPAEAREAHPESEMRLELVIQAVEAAAGRGVAVRFLAEKRFEGTYPETLARLAAVPGIEVRIFDVGTLMGGVLHAKYFVVDGREAYIGSQNFDWRSLAHIQELGLRIRNRALAAAVEELFDIDWRLAAGESVPLPLGAIRPSRDLPEGVYPAFSPLGFLPYEGDWDLPQLVNLIDSAQTRVRVQLLSYHAIARDKSYWAPLENALRRAAARGVQVEMVLANWSKGGSSMAALEALQVTENITVLLATIPDWSGGCVPFGRVVHAKYCVVDGERAWVGTSNWEKSYFHTSRNLGLVMDDPTIAGQLDRFFEHIAGSEYVEPVDPCVEYERVSRDCE
jgi:phosphatidylserine/phosphatidylglycerophosphate/cardiolipin synthase-like enzyme